MNPTADRTRLGRARDSLAWAVCNLMLNHVATDWYRAMIGGSLRLGLQAAAKEASK